MPLMPARCRWRRTACTDADHGRAVRRTVSPMRRASPVTPHRMRGERFLGLDQLLEPAHALGEVDQVGGARALGVAVAQRVVDVPVAPLRHLDRVLLDDRAPEARAQRAAGEVLDQRRERRVARGRDDDAVELLVGRDEGLRRLGGVHLREAALERGEVVLVEPRRRHLGRDRLEDPPHLVELEQRRARQQVADEAHAGQQQLGLEARHVGAVADARLEHADQRERAHGLAQRVAREAEPLREVLLVRQLRAGGELAGHDQVLDLRDRLIGQRRHDACLPPRRDGRVEVVQRAARFRERSCSACCGRDVLDHAHGLAPDLLVVAVQERDRPVAAADEAARARTRRPRRRRPRAGRRRPSRSPRAPC